MKIRTQLLVYGLLPIVLVLTIVLSIHITQMKKLSDDWVNRVRINMIQKETESLRVRIGDKADLSRLIFSRSIYNMDLLLEYSNTSTSTSFPFNYPLFYTIPPLSQLPGTLSVSDKDVRLHNSIHSGWYINGINNVGQRDTHEMANANISNLDNPFYYLYESNVDYLNVYFGRESDGHYQSEPFTETSFNTGNYISCVNGQPFTGYDPRLRPWYCDAVNDPKRTVLTAPYNDALTGEVLVTMARQVDIAYPGKGVFGLDVKLGDLSESITGSKILKNGKFYIVTLDGVAVLYPGIDLNTVRRFEDIIFTTSSDKTAFEPIWNEIISDDTYTGEFFQNGNKWVIVSEKVIPSNLNNITLFENLDVSEINIPYIIIGVVPQSDIEEAANNIQDSANEDINTSLAINIVVIVIFAVLMGIFFWFFSRRIAGPLMRFWQLMRSLGGGSLDCNIEDFDSDDFHTSSDMGALTESIIKLYKFLRAGNINFWDGKWDEALKNYDDVEKIVGTENQRVIGALENNRGAVYEQKEDYQEAAKHFENSIHIGEKLYTVLEKKHKDATTAAESASEDDKLKHEADVATYKNEMTKLESTIRNRKKNHAGLGVAIMKAGSRLTTPQAVKENIDEVMSLAQQAEDMMCIARIKGIEGQYWEILGNTEEAYNCYDTCYKLISEFQRSNPEAFQKQKYALEHATYNFAEFFVNQAETNPAYYNDALVKCGQFNQRTMSDPSVPKRLLFAFIRLQLHIAEKTGRTDIIQSLDSIIKKYPELEKGLSGNAHNKENYFVMAIDKSPSMSAVDIRGQECRMAIVSNCLKKLNTEIIRANDQIHITSFDDKIHELTNNNFVSKELAAPILMQTWKNWLYPNGSGTNYFGVIWKTLKHVSQLQSSNPMGGVINVLVLTDGQNTTKPHHTSGKSEYETHRDNLTMIRRCRINLILITIGNEFNSREINEMVDAANSSAGCFGKHLKADGSLASIEENFKTAAQIMGPSSATVESLVA